MPFHYSFRYIKVIFASLIILLSLKILFFYQTLAKQNLQSFSFDFFLGEHDIKCHYQAKGYLDFYLPYCQELKLGELYTIHGSHSTVIDNVFITYKNFDVKGILLKPINSDSPIFHFLPFIHLTRDYWSWQRQGLKSWYFFFFDFEPAQLGLALSLGTRFNDLAAHLRERFVSLGLSHMIAVSGFHLNLFYFLLSLVLSRFLSRPVSTFGLILTLAWYVILVGSPASVLRAAFMLIFSLIGRVYFGRQVTALYSFFITFFILSLTQVQFLFEVGFQLSFAATFGILFVFPELSQLDQFISLDAWTDWLVLKTGVRSFWLNAWEKIKAALWLSLAAQLLTFPVVVNTFGIYSPWGFVTTILFSGGLAALITLIFLFLIFCLVLGWSDFFVHLIIAPCAWSLNFLLSIFNQISAAIADYLGPPWVIPWQFRPWQLMIYYGLLLVIFFLIKKRRLRYHAYL